MIMIMLKFMPMIMIMTKTGIMIVLMFPVLTVIRIMIVGL